MKDYKLQIGDLVSFDDTEDNAQYGLVTRIAKFENKCWIYWFNKFREMKHNRAMTSISRIKVVSYAEE
tara:strand:- start:1283 stop:1486 length:204 start_codon:yes stop_codon:yes gene_type:complete